MTFETYLITYLRISGGRKKNLLILYYKNCCVQIMHYRPHKF